jgi:hypothetical protein
MALFDNEAKPAKIFDLCPEEPLILVVSVMTPASESEKGVDGTERGC